MDGQLGIEPGHEPAVTAVEPGELRFLLDGAWHPVVVGAGFAEIKADYAVLMVGFAERPDDGMLDRMAAEIEMELFQAFNPRRMKKEDARIILENIFS